MNGTDRKSPISFGRILLLMDLQVIDRRRNIPGSKYRGDRILYLAFQTKSQKYFTKELQKQ